MREPTQMAPPTPVVVVGGGFAGLSAAVALADAGVPVHVVEARPTLGGRANAFRDPASGERIDNGQHILAGCYYETLAFLRRIGTAAKLHRPSTLRVAMIETGGRRTELVCPALPSPLNLFAGVVAWDALSWADRWAILRVGDALRGRTTVPPTETVRDWLTRHHQSPRLCQLFWEPLALAALNQSVDEAAAEMFVAVTSRMFSADPDAASILVPAVPLDDLYVTPALQFLAERGAHVSAPAKARIVVDGHRLHAVRTGSREIPTAVVISAVPWFAMGDLFETPPAAMQSILASAAQLGSAPIVTVDLWLDGWRSPEPMLGLPGRTFQWMFDRRRYVDGIHTHLSLISSGATAICAQSNHRVIATALRDVQAALPDARRATLSHATVIRERRATFSLKPGGPTRPRTETPIKGLYLAGDWIDTGLPATIESAVVSGHRAARAAIGHLRNLS